VLARVAEALLLVPVLLLVPLAELGTDPAAVGSLLEDAVVAAAT